MHTIITAHRKDKAMDVNQVMQAIGTLGFPIVACCALFYYLNKEQESHKSEMPVLNDMVRFEDFVKQPFSGDKFICHCYEESDLDNKILLREALLESDDSVVLVGPEGDFSIDEVKLAIENGFRSVSLGNSRLRTETAALVAVHLMRLK
jgi:16S rRNA (uracil1498-N3)-methyltransferase